MGEPTPESHRRNHDFSFWPFDSTADLVDYAEWLVALVQRDAHDPLEVALTISIFGRDREPPIPFDEIRERLDEFQFKEIYEASMKAREQDDSLTLWLKLIPEVLTNNRATVTITGSDRDRVLFIKDEVRREGEARVESIERRAAEAKAAAGREEAFKRQEAAVGIGDAAGDILRADAKRSQEREQRGRVAPRKPFKEAGHAVVKDAEKPGRSRKHRFFYNPWTITIGGGLLVGLMILAVTLIIAA